MRNEEEKEEIIKQTAEKAETRNKVAWKGELFKWWRKPRRQKKLFTLVERLNVSLLSDSW